MGQPGQRVRQGRAFRPGLLGRQAQTVLPVHLDQLVRLDRRVRLVQKVHQDHQVHLVLPVRQDRRVQAVQKLHPDQPVRPGHSVQGGPLGLQLDPRVRAVLKLLLVHRDRKGHRDR